MFRAYNRYVTKGGLHDKQKKEMTVRTHFSVNVHLYKLVILRDQCYCLLIMLSSMYTFL